MAATCPAVAPGRRASIRPGGWPTVAAALALAVLVDTGPPRAAEAPPHLTRTVNDFAQVIDLADKQHIEQLARRLREATGDTVVVATITSLDGEDIRAYATRMFENGGAGIGQKGQDNGLLVLLAVRDREVRVEVGYGLEALITDGFAGEVSREVMRPYFVRRAYSVGLREGVNAIVGRLVERRGARLDVPTPRKLELDRSHEWRQLWLLGMMALTLGYGVFMASRGRMPRGLGLPGGPWHGRARPTDEAVAHGPGGRDTDDDDGASGAFRGGRSGGGGGGASW